MTHVEFILLFAGIGSALVLTLGWTDSFFKRRRLRIAAEKNHKEWS
jgi:hypothetical protein